MKKIIASASICLILCIALSLVGCGNEFAKREYNDTEKILQLEDRYAKENSVFNPINGGYSLTASKFNGRQTLWNKTVEENADMEVRLDLSVSSGHVKVVYIDCDNSITVLAECSQANSDKQSVMKSLSLKVGLNRFKIVGYNCKAIDLKLYFDEP